MLNLKTKVEVIEEVHQCIFNIGDTGYIDGYCRAGDNIGYAIVVVCDKLDFVPFYALRVIL